ncbi:hypothetical protein CALVIDRAFT_124757 [Calocera viscosa TUFC12733]|uniref:Uncharacterized protein n=1 Tax=Calocera viscosa (strain TUFC12733) TaxID=1330018 RepID=A0A167RQB1_CALVF|nr:hypothetical protein CALVIDRAFT_124757 [Calocera viscosa TUFC12733]
MGTDYMRRATGSCALGFVRFPFAGSKSANWPTERLPVPVAPQLRSALRTPVPLGSPCPPPQAARPASFQLRDEQQLKYPITPLPLCTPCHSSLFSPRDTDQSRQCLLFPPSSCAFLDTHPPSRPKYHPKLAQPSPLDYLRVFHILIRKRAFQHHPHLSSTEPSTMKFSILSTVTVLSLAVASFAAPIAAPPSSDGFFGPSWGGSGKRDIVERAPPKPDCGFFGPCWYGGGKREAAPEPVAEPEPVPVAEPEAAPPKPDCGFFGPCWYGGGKA